MISAIAAILAITPRLTLITGILVVLIAIIGLLAIRQQVNRLFRTAMAQKLLALRLEEGQALFEKNRLMGLPQVSMEDLRDWDNLTEENLRKYMDEPNVARFRFAGYRDQPGGFTTYRLEQKLNFLNELLEQLKD